MLVRLSEDIAPLVKFGPPEQRALHERLSGEQRDDVWATRSEATMRIAYAMLAGVGEAGRKIDVVCGATVCQISGSLEDLPGSSGGDVMHAVQSQELLTEMAALGYRQMGSTFGPGGHTPELFITYYERAKPENITM